MDKDTMTDYKNLYRAYRKTKSGKRFNQSAARFSTVALDGVNQIRQQLIDETYRISPYNEFKIYEPKERVIKSCSFKDKVVQRCLCSNILLPRLKDVFVTDNYAGQIGKGTLFGMERLKKHMMDFFDEHGNDGWFLKCDIKKYFYSMDHEVLKKIVDGYFDDAYTMWLNHLFIDSTESPGVPLGNQVAQVYALLMLHDVETKVQQELGIKYYGRYMDDFFLIHENKDYLKHCLKEIKSDVENAGLSLNGKTQLIPFRKGISFLGFHHYMTDDGKYIRKLKGEKKREIRKKLRRWSKAVKSGKMSERKFYGKYEAWKKHALQGNCIKLCHSMDLYVEELMK